MKITSSNLFVSITDPSMKDVFFKKKIEYNLELALFCLPEVLNGSCKKTVSDVKQVFKKYPVKRLLHGPFHDLAYDSKDKSVQELVRNKMELSLEIAGEIGAKHMVVHSTFNPLNPDPSYPKVWLERSVLFWKKLLPKARKNKCMIVFENIYDENPKWIKKLISQVSSPNFKACLDIGHAHIFGNVSIVEWIKLLRKDLYHLHIHDNNGKRDEHLGIGAGSIDFDAIFDELARIRHIPACTIEVKSEREMNRSIRYLKEKKLLQAED